MSHGSAELGEICPGRFEGDATYPDELNLGQLVGNSDETIKAFARLDLSVAHDNSSLRVKP